MGDLERESMREEIIEHLDSIDEILENSGSKVDDDDEHEDSSNLDDHLSEIHDLVDQLRHLILEE